MSESVNKGGRVNESVESVSESVSESVNKGGRVNESVNEWVRQHVGG